MNDDALKNGEGAEHDWNLLVEAYRPPHEESDWFSPIIWPLLEAAMRQPFLRAFFPSTAMNHLVIYWNDQAWCAAEEERWPAISVSSDGIYTVRSDAWSRNARELLTTSDPEVAANFLAAKIGNIKDRVSGSPGSPSA
ncbi:MAG TPA: DUF6193 family natural product biosynthesis protein [Actinocrinis sp.]|uniref:DUF6193 family natural product biosynthesis protein n=1 Tax=Actinocrinis sp. TaxID=1920516 RepID=UPI002D72A218|nr:DUF6193 family natural product biosynthesis protein [Actinocrinis sp.]HZU54987.1 DUF6193 family natural product biosynthesis protein [Actinocrinis sp.]